MNAPVAIVGGGPAGLAAARAYREAGGRDDVLMLTADDRPPYRRPPLTKDLLRGEMDAADLLIEPEAWYAEQGVELRCGVRVVAVDAGGRSLELADGSRVAYRECVLCTGSEPAVPPIPGVDSPRVHPVRSARDGLALAAAARPGGRAVVIGAGFIGCEAAASLALRGLEVALVAPEPAPQQERLGDEVGAILAGWLDELGVRVALGRDVDAIHETAAGVRVSAGDEELEADLAVLGTGARPLTGLAEGAGLELQSGGVPTDAAMRTAAEGLSCAGDPAFAHNASAGRRLRVEHWGEALDQGAVAGRALTGEAAAWAGPPGFWSTIGRRTIKQAAWGDGWDSVRVEGGADGFVARYGRDGVLVGVLTHERDDDYAEGAAQVERGAPFG